MAHQVFNETQNYRGTWVMYLIIMTELPMLLLVAIILFKSKTDSNEIFLHLGLVLLIMSGTFLLLMNIQLQTRIDHKGVHYRYIPFLNKWRIIHKQSIQAINLITYSPISDYGGWGMKGNRTTKAFSILGDQGILIDVGEKKKIMLGTKKTAELESFLENWMEN